MFHELVHAFVDRDYALARGVASVAPVPPATARQIAASIEDYGATLVDLTADTWKSSVAQWSGRRWDVLIDLRTAEEGCSDLTLFATVRESHGRYTVEVDGVWSE